MDRVPVPQRTTNVCQFIGVPLAVLFAFGTTSAFAQILVVNQDISHGTHAIQPHAPVAQLLHGDLERLAGHDPALH